MEELLQKYDNAYTFTHISFKIFFTHTPEMIALSEHASVKLFDAKIKETMKVDIKGLEAKASFYMDAYKQADTIRPQLTEAIQKLTEINDKYVNTFKLSIAKALCTDALGSKIDPTIAFQSKLLNETPIDQRMTVLRTLIAQDIISQLCDTTIVDIHRLQARLITTLGLDLYREAEIVQALQLA